MHQDNSSPTARITGSISLNNLIAFVFGIIFLIAMLIFSVSYPNPKEFQIKVFVTTLALAAAGIGAMLPGTLNISYKPVARAGGALALFAAVYFFQPAITKSTVTIIPPSEPAEPIALHFLSSVDNGALVQAWSQLDPDAIGVTIDTFQNFEIIFNNYRLPLGNVEKREVVGGGSMQSPPGFPIGLYKTIGYRTKFKSSSGCRPESVTLRATQNLEWKTFNYSLGPSNIEC